MIYCQGFSTARVLRWRTCVQIKIMCMISYQLYTFDKYSMYLRASWQSIMISNLHRGTIHAFREKRRESGFVMNCNNTFSLRSQTFETKLWTSELQLSLVGSKLQFWFCFKKIYFFFNISGFGADECLVISKNPWTFFQFQKQTVLLYSSNDGSKSP